MSFLITKFRVIRLKDSTIILQMITKVTNLQVFSFSHQILFHKLIRTITISSPIKWITSNKDTNFKESQEVAFTRHKRATSLNYPQITVRMQSKVIQVHLTKVMELQYHLTWYIKTTSSSLPNQIIAEISSILCHKTKAELILKGILEVQTTKGKESVVVRLLETRPCHRKGAMDYLPLPTQVATCKIQIQPTLLNKCDKDLGHKATVQES